MGIVGVEIGQVVKFAKTVGETDVTLYAGLTGDFSDTHVNDQYMKEKSVIGERIAHGALLVGYMSTASTISIQHIIHRDDIEEFPLNQGFDKVRFLKPVKLGDTVTTTYRVAEIDEERRRSTGEIECHNQHGELVAVGRQIMKWSKHLSTKAD